MLNYKILSNGFAKIALADNDLDLQLKKLCRHPLRCPRSSPRQCSPRRTRPPGQHWVSTSARTQDAFGNNAFGYTIKDGLGATNSRSEVGDGYGNRKGSTPSPTSTVGPDEWTTLLTDTDSGLPSRPTNLEPLLVPQLLPSSTAPTPVPLPQSSTTWPQLLPYAAPLAVAAPSSLWWCDRTWCRTRLRSTSWTWLRSRSWPWLWSRSWSWSWWCPWFGIWLGFWQGLIH
ncbi:hypothetical protein CEXT_500312 [Caerostris extrusa]|uniref:Uncharacterized protein n=1 Tax=Caerostris extrusa TaxID=172846 RepID=A0AAV4PL03_CAEEX|nr:hypothetical protein CEXT_500312 [Caerostris extrusa]